MVFILSRFGHYKGENSKVSSIWFILLLFYLLSSINIYITYRPVERETAGENISTLTVTTSDQVDTTSN